MSAARNVSRALLLALIASLSPPVRSAEPDLSQYFGEYQGCALIESRDRYEQVGIEFHPGRCALPLSPCSTFKIPNALIGLESGVVSGPDDLKPWDGVERGRKINNQDHTLASAIRHSVVWYFQDLARDVGQESMQQWLDRLDYGNRDISGGIDRFWLGSSLEIDAYQQLHLIQALWRDGLPFAPEHQEQVRAMLLLESTLDGDLHGKTGSCLGDPESATPDHGWFVGWVDWNPARSSATWFAVNIAGTGARGWKAREIALAVLGDLEH